MNAVRTDFREAKVGASMAKLESDMAHVRSDLSDMKLDIRELRARMEGWGEKLESRLDALAGQLNKAIVWALLLYIAFAGTLLAVMARGLKWM